MVVPRDGPPNGGPARNGMLFRIDSATRPSRAPDCGHDSDLPSADARSGRAAGAAGRSPCRAGAGRDRDQACGTSSGPTRRATRAGTAAVRVTPDRTDRLAILVLDGDLAPVPGRRSSGRSSGATAIGASPHGLRPERRPVVPSRGARTRESAPARPRRSFRHACGTAPLSTESGGGSPDRTMPTARWSHAALRRPSTPATGNATSETPRRAGGPRVDSGGGRPYSSGGSPSPAGHGSDRGRRGRRRLRRARGRSETPKRMAADRGQANASGESRDRLPSFIAMALRDPEGHRAPARGRHGRTRRHARVHRRIDPVGDLQSVGLAARRGGVAVHASRQHASRQGSRPGLRSAARSGIGFGCFGGRRGGPVLDLAAGESQRWNDPPHGLPLRLVEIARESLGDLPSDRLPP